MKQLTTVVDLLREIKNKQPNPTALNHLENGEWRSHSTEQMLDEIKYFALGLKALGLKDGETVGLLGFPSPKWTIVDLAIIVAGFVTVPLFANISNENFVFEVTQTKTRVLIISGKDQWNIYEKHRELFEIVIILDKNAGFGISYDDVLGLGRDFEKKNPNLYSRLEEAAKPDALATIIYTSGSTGIPKGAELTQQNLVALINIDVFRWNHRDDRYLNILPLAHVFGRLLNLFMIGWSISVYYTDDIKNIGAVCRTLHPTVLVVVPRVLEKVYSKMLASVEHAGFMKRKLGLWAFELANTYEDSLYKHLMHPIADKTVYTALRNALGGSIRLIISGGAPLNPHLCHFFNEIGVQIYEGWGLTEASTVCVNTIAERKVGTVGKPLPGVQVMLGKDNELLVKGPIVIRGYHKNPDVNGPLFDENGWLRTGDKGEIDAEGYVTIKGRLKEMYKTSTGEYIAPVPIEQSLCKAALVDMALVIGQDRKYASALLFPDLDVLHSMKAAHNEKDMSDDEFLESKFVKDEMDALINNINTRLNHWEQLHAYRFVLTPLTVESGELTPSMKIRREVVTQNYKHLIDQMYLEEVKI